MMTVEVGKDGILITLKFSFHLFNKCTKLKNITNWMKQLCPISQQKWKLCQVILAEFITINNFILLITLYIALLL